MSGSPPLSRVTAVTPSTRTRTTLPSMSSSVLTMDTRAMDWPSPLAEVGGGGVGGGVADGLSGGGPGVGRGV